MQGLRYTSTRRQFLRATGVGAGGIVAGSVLFRAARGEALTPPEMALAATDGHILLPNRPGDSPLYILGFTAVPFNDSVSTLVNDFKGRAQTPAPILGFDQNTDTKLKLTNLGLLLRPDLADAHTVHWHGFRTPPALTDGVPEVSVAVPPNRQFTYFYRPHDAGTYMYHCHFEDVEHVQMGMTGIVFVRPPTPPGGSSGDQVRLQRRRRPSSIASSRSCSTRSGRCRTTTSSRSRRASGPTTTRSTGH